jgi:hypothetical protein
MRSLVAVLLISAALVGCSDTVTTTFVDYHQAQIQGAFDRGWLPPILPPSTKNITESNNLDLNIGEGFFTFSPEEIATFTVKGAQAIKINPASGSPQHKYQKEGCQFLTFSKDSTSWLIAIHQSGKGAYWVETKK